MHFCEHLWGTEGLLETVGFEKTIQEKLNIRV